MKFVFEDHEKDPIPQLFMKASPIYFDSQALENNVVYDE